jgi:hypothetical protein
MRHFLPVDPTAIGEIPQCTTKTDFIFSLFLFYLAESHFSGLQNTRSASPDRNNPDR